MTPDKHCAEGRDGGPAFPGTWTEMHTGMPYQFSAPGMSLRDWFAGQALGGIYASREQYLSILADRGATDPEIYVAIVAYRMADGMLAARQALSNEERG
ncbi:MAG: hypothetical protein LCH88_09005 [Proteobacteria bacterium]|nr:hypothetical protein [Pseudomonadota bacterium]